MPTSPPLPPYPEGHQLLAGKTVLVTASAGTGTGFATAKRCAEEGAEVVLSDLHERRLQEAADSLEPIMGKRPTAILCNVTQEDQVQALFDGAIDATGGVDILVNNAGLGGTSDLLEMSDEQWSSVLDVTLNGTMRCTRAAMRYCNICSLPCSCSYCSNRGNGTASR